MNIDFPYQFDHRGRTAATDYENHIRDMIEQVLFTSPGERVNRPTFGSGLLQLVFAPNSDELAGTTQFLVQSALQEWAAGNRRRMPQYDVIDRSGPDHAAEFTVRVSIHNVGEADAVASSKGEAEKLAAKAFLEKYG